MRNQSSLSVGVYDDLDSAQRSLAELREHGFRSEEIGVIGHVGDSQEPIATPTEMKAPESNVTRGVLIGGLFGAIVGLLVIGLVPGMAELGGGRWAEFAAAGVLGAATGGYLYAFERLFLSRRRGGIYEAELQKGRFIVVVKNPARQQEAVEVLSHRAVHSGIDPNR